MAPPQRQWITKVVGLLQVERRGKFTPAGVKELAKHVREKSLLRQVLIVLIFPFPSLLVTLTVEFIPLAAPTDGAAANWALFARLVGVVFVFSFLVFFQFSHLMPTLPFSMLKNAIQATFVSITQSIISFIIAWKVFFPIPFGFITLSPLWMVLVITSMVVGWAKDIKDQMPGIKEQLIKANNAWNCASTLLVIYPAYYYAYSLLSPTGRTAFSIVLPLIKVVLRTMFCAPVAHLKDEAPVAILFDVDVFNGLFMTYCMQSTPSPLTTGGLTLVGLLQAALALLDLNTAVCKANHYCRKSLQLASDELVIKSSELSEQSLVVKAAYIIDSAGDTFTEEPSQKSTRTASRASFLVTSPLRPIRRLMTKIAPGIAIEDDLANLATNSFVKTSTMDGAARATRNRRKCVGAVQQALYAIEFLILISYIDMIMPMIYGELSMHRILIECSY